MLQNTLRGQEMLLRNTKARLSYFFTIFLDSEVIPNIHKNVYSISLILITNVSSISNKVHTLFNDNKLIIEWFFIQCPVHIIIIVQIIRISVILVLLFYFLFEIEKTPNKCRLRQSDLF